MLPLRPDRPRFRPLHVMPVFTTVVLASCGATTMSGPVAVFYDGHSRTRVGGWQRLNEEARHSVCVSLATVAKLTGGEYPTKLYDWDSAKLIATATEDGCKLPGL